MKRRTGWILAAALVGAAAAVGISRIDFERALREVTLPLQHEDIIRQEAGQRDLDPALVAAVIYAESRFRDQTSDAGARGLMQITPETAQKVADLSGGTQFVTGDLSDPDINIAYGCYWLRYLLDRYGGNETLALAAYNGGEGNVDRWLVRASKDERQFAPDDIPFPETRAYVDRVQQARDDYRDTYADELGL